MATDLWVGAKQTVGQRIIPVLRINSATAVSYSLWDISGSLSISCTIELRGGNDPQSLARMESGFLLTENYVSAARTARTVCRVVPMPQTTDLYAMWRQLGTRYARRSLKPGFS
jgi:hypothetical protein